MTTFPIPKITAERIARLGLACADEFGVLGHIGVRVTLNAVRFAATNGRILASLIVPIEQLIGNTLDLILDADQLTAALKSTAKAIGGRITVEIGPKEARFTTGSSSAIVRRIDGVFPVVEHAWTRPAGRQWVPSMSSLDPALVGIVQKISGNKKPLLFDSPADPAAHLERLWAVPGAKPDESLSLASMRAAVVAPAYWADHELAFLVMPITRTDAERQIDLSQHALALPQPVAAAA